MDVTLFFSTQKYEIPYFEESNLAFKFTEAPLNAATAKLAHEHRVVCCFVNDSIDADCLAALSKGQTKLIALRCAGFNNVDLKAAKKYGIHVVRVPKYSPHAVAEFAVGLILSLARKYHRAYFRNLEHNFSLQGLKGFDLHGKTVGVIGTGKIGNVFYNIMQGFGCKLLANDPEQQPDLNYTDLDTLLSTADIISLHCPLNENTYHLIDAKRLTQMKDGVMLINTSRGGLIDTKAMITGLKSGKIGYLGVDVYEEEADLFFQDLSEEIIQDDVFARLQTFPNVMITAHQAFFTHEAMSNIAETTINNIQCFLNKQPLENQVVL